MRLNLFAGGIAGYAPIYERFYVATSVTCCPIGCSS